MGWESRKRGTSYYTRSFRRADGGVGRSYVGTGPVAQLLASLDELKRLEKEEEDLRFEEGRRRFEEAVAFLVELEEVTKTLTAAHLVAVGAHRHKGTWRFRRT